MKQKTKLIALVMSICLVCAVFAIGVFALKTANLKIGGDVSFTATGINADIIDAKLTNGETITNLNNVSITTAKTQAEIDSQMTNWTTLPINFNAEGNDVVLSFKMANTSTGKSYIEFGYDYTFTKENANIMVLGGAGNKALLDPKESSDAENNYIDYQLIFRIIDKELSVPNGTKINLTINLVHPEPTMLDDTLVNNSYYSDGELVYSLGGTSAQVMYPVSGVTDIVVPSLVEKDGVVYKVTSIYGEGFLNKSINSLYVGKCVTSISSPFTGARNLIISSSCTALPGDNGCFSFGGSESLIVENGNPIYDSRDNCNGIIETATNTALYVSSKTVIPQSVKTIGKYAYKGSYSSITIPEHVTTLEILCFYFVTVDTLTLPKTITTIKGSPFESANITNLYIGCDVDLDYCFGNCYATNVHIQSSYPQTRALFSYCNSNPVNVYIENQDYIDNDGFMFGKYSAIGGGTGNTKVYIQVGLDISAVEIPEGYSTTETTGDANSDGYIEYTYSAS